VDEYLKIIVMLAAIIIFIVSLSLQVTATGQTNSANKKELPGYYQFFMKTGQLTRIKPEIERDRQIESGELKTIAIDQPLPEFVLPLASGEKLKLNSYLDRRNLLIVSFRSWW
jgi:hypothetical protein